MIETLYCLCDQLQLSIVPYIVFLVVPVLGTMSAPDHQIRLLATSTFASLVRLMPLDGGVPEPENLSPELKLKKEREKEFLSQLLDSKTAVSYELSVPVNAELRSYQVAGINWLAFLNKYKLHGILCDDMGLGKTLQSICMMAQVTLNPGVLTSDQAHKDWTKIFGILIQKPLREAFKKPFLAGPHKMFFLFVTRKFDTFIIHGLILYVSIILPSVLP